MDISSLTLAQLRDLDKKVSAQIVIRQKKDREQAIEQIYSIANNLGVPLKNLLNSKTPKTAMAPKYVNPNDPSKTWHGRGPRPQWIKDAIAAGKSLDSLQT